MGRNSQTEPARRDAPRRADAARNIEAILDAAARCFTENVDASMTEIAKAAGVGRVTLYAHFPSREALLTELMDRNLHAASAALDAASLDQGPADRALARFLHESWRILDRHHGLVAASLRHLPEPAVRARHDPVTRRVEALILRGQQAGTFRSDLPLSWLVTTAYTLTHAAVRQVDEGELESATALAALEATLLSCLKP